jgi:hypothetical protein
MLILPPGHAETVRVRRAITRREKRMIGALLAVVAGLLIALVLSLTIGGHSSRNGCIYATIPAATGAQQINQCGATARATCESATAPGAFTAAASRTIVAECRKAGLPVGAPPLRHPAPVSR